MTTKQLCQDFLKLDGNDLPGAWLDEDEDSGDAWSVVHAIARGKEVGPHNAGFAERLYLRADVDGWRKAVEIDLTKEVV